MTNPLPRERGISSDASSLNSVALERRMTTTSLAMGRILLQ